MMFSVGGNISWYSHCVKLWRFFIKLKTELPYYLAVPFLTIIYIQTKLIQKDTCTLTCIAALLTIAISRWMDEDVVHIHVQRYYSDIKERMK